MAGLKVCMAAMCIVSMTGVDAGDNTYYMYKKPETGTPTRDPPPYTKINKGYTKLVTNPWRPGSRYEDVYNKDGYNVYDYNKDGYNVLGFNKDGYNVDGYNSMGYNVDGYNNKGYNEDGYNKDGYNVNGYNTDGYNVDGYNNKGYSVDGYNSKGYNVDGYNNKGYNVDGYNNKGYNVDGYNNKGYNVDGYNNMGYNVDGYNNKGYNVDGYNNNGYNVDGYNNKGYNVDGYNNKGYNVDGYNNKGYNVDGYKEDGYNSKGYNKEGYNKDGYNEDGFNNKGYNKEGYNKDGYDKDGNSKDTTNECKSATFTDMPKGVDPLKSWGGGVMSEDMYASVKKETKNKKLKKKIPRDGANLYSSSYDSYKRPGCQSNSYSSSSTDRYNWDIDCPYTTSSVTWIEQNNGQKCYLMFPCIEPTRVVKCTNEFCKNRCEDAYTNTYSNSICKENENVQFNVWAYCPPNNAGYGSKKDPCAKSPWKCMKQVTFYLPQSCDCWSCTDSNK